MCDGIWLTVVGNVVDSLGSGVLLLRLYRGRS